jgi:hypothetical protein
VILLINKPRDENGGLDMPGRARSKHDEEAQVLQGNNTASWTVAIDESPPEGWILEVDSPQVYLTFQLANLSAIDCAIDLLESSLALGAENGEHRFNSTRDEVLLGHFGGTAVRLLRDDEDFLRCFVVVLDSRSTLRVNLDEENIRLFAGALKRAREDCPQPPEETRSPSP